MASRIAGRLFDEIDYARDEEERDGIDDDVAARDLRRPLNPRTPPSVDLWPCSLCPRSISGVKSVGTP